MTTKTEPTVREWAEDLAGRNTSTRHDEIMMLNVLRRIGFGAAVVTCGVVYLEGKGTLEAPPASIQSVARLLLKAEGGGK